MVLNQGYLATPKIILENTIPLTDSSAPITCLEALSLPTPTHGRVGCFFICLYHKSHVPPGCPTRGPHMWRQQAQDILRRAHRGFSTPAEEDGGGTLHEATHQVSHGMDEVQKMREMGIELTKSILYIYIVSYGE